MSREAWAGLLGLALGSIGSALWTRWRSQVVHELRAIRELLERANPPKE